MACPISMFKLLGDNAQTGGNWTMESSITNLIYGTGADADTPPVTYSGSSTLNSGDPLSSTEYLWVDMSAVPKGSSFKFKYTISSGGAVTSSTITLITRNAALSGTAATGVQWCKDDTEPKVLWDLLFDEPYTNGTWTGNGTTMPGYSTNNTTSPTDDTFTPAGNGLSDGDTLQFIYTVQNSDDLDCAECASSTVINIDINDSCSDPYPCGCQFTRARYYLDIFDLTGIAPNNNAAWLIESFVFDGTEYAPSPVSITGGNSAFQSTQQCKFVGGSPKITRYRTHYNDVSSAINALNIPNFSITDLCYPSYPVPITTGTQAYVPIGKYYELTFPTCLEWTLLFSINGDPWMRWTNTGVERFRKDTLAWQDITFINSMSECPDVVGSPGCLGWDAFGTVNGAPSLQGVKNLTTYGSC